MFHIASGRGESGSCNFEPQRKKERKKKRKKERKKEIEPIKKKTKKAEGRKIELKEKVRWLYFTPHQHLPVI